MSIWVYSLRTATFVSGCFRDELEVKWLRECWSKSCDELASSGLDGVHDQVRWISLDIYLARALQGMNRSSCAYLPCSATNMFINALLRLLVSVLRLFMTKQ